jgi:RNA polymerase sigma-70 factor (ECF subfamily)
MNVLMMNLPVSSSFTKSTAPPLLMDAAEPDIPRLRTDSEDIQDIQTVLNGDNSAFDRLVARYERKIANQMWHYTHDRIILEELVQEVFVSAFMGLRSFKGKGPFLHWLRVIATRVGYAFWKDRKKAASYASLDKALDVCADVPDKDSMNAETAGMIIHAVFEKLSPRNRMVLTLQYLENCSMKEIAERMGWTPAGTKMQAMRARNKLKKLIKKHNLMEKFGWMK